LNQLLVEYEEICWNYKLQLTPPVFEISHSRREVGSWNPETRTIRLSCHLIIENSWTVTLQVLKHEMAHQLCSEKFADEEKGHGRQFQKMCELLGVESAFRRPQSSLPELRQELQKESEVSKSGRRFIEKVEKLLALARSPNEHEASLAMRKANELIERYNIKFFEAGKEREFGFAVIDRKRKRIESYQRHICRILQDFFFVRVIMSSLYDPIADQSYKTIELLGARENVVIGEYCYFFLENKLASLWAHNRYRFKGRTITERNSYFLGLLAGFYDKLNKQQRPGTGENVEADSVAMALVVAEKKLDRYISSRFPRLKTVSRRSAKIYKKTYNDGVKTGKTITLSKGVAENSVQSGRFLSDV